ncbi:nesprin-4 [Dromiciops gliroides]|uniref:nesprin-4 n=1 Tax=Dromiciops gliroides TaxID=33562 RepID=UPI001CC70B94|nr:nesprin-4 [Dromiciops gliroides]XP_043846974.1 nesprin-4 [Dromiciops gliroides]
MWKREPWRAATHEEGIFRHLCHRHRGRLIAYSLVFEDPTSIQDPDSDTDSDGPGTGPGGLGLPRVGIGGERGPPLEAELEWDPTGDVGRLGALRSKTVWTPGSPCEVCGRAEPLAVWSLRPRGPPRSFRAQDRKQPSPPDVTVQIPLGSGSPEQGGGSTGAAQPRWPRCSLLFLLLLLLFGVACLFPPPRGPLCPPRRLSGPLHLVLSYVNGPPPT